jgi:hypothetical protein
MSFLADGADALVINTGNASFHVSTWPLLIELPVSYEATDSPLPSDEDEQGNIVPNAHLDDRSNDLGETTDAGEAEAPL